MTGRPVARVAFAATLATLAALAWLGYRRPELAVWLANSISLCS